MACSATLEAGGGARSGTKPTALLAESPEKDGRAQWLEQTLTWKSRGHTCRAGSRVTRRGSAIGWKRCVNKFAVLLSSALIAGCTQPMSSMRSALPSALANGARSTNTFRLVHSFGYGADGNGPQAGLIELNGNLYGTTIKGGDYGVDGTQGGTVFVVSPSGRERVLHSFGRGLDGATPASGLAAVDDVLYGTTVFGGAYAGGTLFRIDASGANYRVIHSFWQRHGGNPPPSYCGCSLQPFGLIYANGLLYGVAGGGGGGGGLGEGVLYSITTDGNRFRIIHSFGQGSDGAFPLAAPLDVKGTLFGTTEKGGSFGNGTVYSVSPVGKYRLLHSFGAGTDGSQPMASLMVFQQALYGTTSGGGEYGGGTVFRLDGSTGVERILHNFGNGSDGVAPISGLVAVGSLLYGVTFDGGGIQCCAGVAFSIDPGSGQETILHTFGNGDGGVGADGPLVYLDGALYGVTWCGGKFDASTCGPYYGRGGAVFALRI